MAAAGTLGTVGCLWPPATTILPTSSPSSSDTSRMSATTNVSGLSLSARLNRSTCGPVASGSLRYLSFLLAPAVSTATVQTLASSFLPLAAPSPVPAATARSCPSPAALLPAGCAVDRVSGLGGDNSTTDDAK